MSACYAGSLCGFWITVIVLALFSIWMWRDEIKASPWGWLGPIGTMLVLVWLMRP